MNDETAKRRNKKVEDKKKLRRDKRREEKEQKRDLRRQKAEALAEHRAGKINFDEDKPIEIKAPVVDSSIIEKLKPEPKKTFFGKIFGRFKK